jgi:hypothetical protein
LISALLVGSAMRSSEKEDHEEDIKMYRYKVCVRMVSIIGRQMNCALHDTACY